MEEGPKGCISITKPYRGRITLNTRVCPEGCQACVDACPTDALTYDGLYCSFEQELSRIVSYAESAYERISSELKHEISKPIPMIAYKTSGFLS